MHSLRAAVAASGVILLAARAPLPAQQDGWNDVRTMALVRAATARRAVQLADTGLRDYTARATGTVTFLTQFGERFRTPPAVVKSDQIALEVYWRAPDLSKQRIVGRRDTLLLPSDMEYHRDHLGIIQNNFPDFIRLGDGDEVLDVPHPLSALGEGTYDYRVADSLAIRGQGVAIDVMMVSLRPKDPRAPAAVGAVYLDRQTASVVRMTFSFTRAALRDPQLEDVSVILENGLVDGRFWLPRRQEIEIRRTASWMDFPVLGIIRGRWEVCCIATNQTVPPAVFVGEEISEAGPPEQLRAWPFVGELLDAVPDDVRELDAPDVRAVQEEARRLVQAGALARARRASLAARSVSDFVRSDRHEGLALGAGVSRRIGAGFSVEALGRYGFADRRAKGRAVLAWRQAAGSSIAVRAYDDWHQLGAVPEVSGVRNAIASQEFGSDWTSPIGVRGAAVRVEFARGGRWFLDVSARSERPLPVVAGSAWGRQRAAFPAVALDRRAVALGWARAWRSPQGRLQLDVAPEASIASLAGSGVPGVPERLGRLAVDAELAVAGSAGAVVLRTVAAGVVGVDRFPAQDAVLFGGPITGPGYAVHSLRGRTGVSQRVEWRRRVPFVPLDLGRFGRVPASLQLAPYAHAVWLDRPEAAVGAWHPSVGLAAIGFFDLLRVDVARGLADGRWMFSLDVSRGLWPVL